MKRIKLIFAIFFYVFFNGNLLGNSNFNIKIDPSSDISLENIWENISVTNNTAQSYDNVYLEIIIKKNERKEKLRFRSIVFRLNKHDFLNTIVLDTAPEYIETIKQFPSGEYTICVKLKINHYAVAQQCEDNINIRNSNPTDKKSNFSGSTANFYWFYADRINNPYYQAEIHPKVTIRGLPLGMRAIITNNQRSVEERLSSIQFYFDHRSYKTKHNKKHRKTKSEIELSIEEIKLYRKIEIKAWEKDSANSPTLDYDRKIHKKRLEKYDKLLELYNSMSAKDKQDNNFWSYLHTLEIGDVFPSYSSLTLNGVRVTGLNLEANPNNFYFAFVGGKLQNSFFAPQADTLRSQYNRNLYAARFGVGKKDRTHFFITTMYSADNLKSLADNFVSESIDTFEVSPKSNFLLGGELKLMPFKNSNIYILAEGVSSTSTMDTRVERFKGKNADVFHDFPFWSRWGGANPTSKHSFAYDTRIVFRPKYETNITAFVRQVGPGFESLGAPYLQNDFFQYGINAHQYLFERGVFVSAYYNRNRDNRITAFKQDTTNLNIFGGRLRFTLEELGSLQISYRNSTQANQNDAFIDFTSSTLSFSANIAEYNIFGKKLRTNLSYLQRRSTNIINPKINTFNFQNRLYFNTVADASIRFNYNQREGNNIVGLNMSARYRGRMAEDNSWSLYGGLGYYNNGVSVRKLAFGEAAYQFSQVLRLKVRLENNWYDETINRGYGFAAQTFLEVTWK